MKNKNIKTRRLNLLNVVAADEKEMLLKRIQVEEGVIHAEVENNNLTLQYDVNVTALEHLLLNIKTDLENSGIKFNDSFFFNLKTGFVYFVESNQRDNKNKPSGWHLRLQHIYLALAEQDHEYHDIKNLLKK